jgi:IclR family acetate operon transcriptional repressor
MSLIEPIVRRRGRPPGTRAPDTIQSLVKGLAIIDFLADSGQPVGVTEVANHVGVPKATAHRLLATLHANDAVSYDNPSHRYTLGPSIIRFGLLGVRRLSLHRVARPHLERLQHESGETALLATRQGNAKIFLDQVESAEEIRHCSTLGQRLPLYHGGGGLAMLASFKPDELDDYLAQVRFEKISATTITEPEKLRAEIEMVRKRGYAITRSERVTSIGAPILDHMKVVVGAIAVHGPTYRMGSDRTQICADAVKARAAAISSELGYSDAE